jgi:hypothetical protein
MVTTILESKGDHQLRQVMTKIQLSATTLLFLLILTPAGRSHAQGIILDYPTKSSTSSFDSGVSSQDSVSILDVLTEEESRGSGHNRKQWCVVTGRIESPHPSEVSLEVGVGGATRKTINVLVNKQNIYQQCCYNTWGVGLPYRCSDPQIRVRDVKSFGR